MGNVAQDQHTVSDQQSPATVELFLATQQSPRFAALRRSHRLFVLPVTAACLLWYLSYVLLAGYAPQVLATPVWGSVNLGIVLGLAQVATTFAVTTVYVMYANRRLDPAAAEIRAELEAAIVVAESEGVRA